MKQTANQSQSQAGICSSQVRDLAGPRGMLGGSIRQPAGSRTRLEQGSPIPRLLTTAFALVLMLLAAGGAVLAAPGPNSPKPLPDLLIYGTAGVGANDLAAGTVSVLLPRGGEVTAEVLSIAGTNYTFVLAVPLSQYAAGSDPAAFGPDTAVAGDQLQFLINGSPAFFKDQNGFMVDKLAVGPGSLGQAYVMRLSITGPDQFRLGDVNANGRRDSADALLVIKYDVGLVVGGDAFPPGPGTIYLPLCDVVENGNCNSGDALRILQCDVGMAGVSCPGAPLSATGLGSDLAPAISDPTPDAALSLGALLQSGPEPDQISVTVQVDTGQVDTGQVDTGQADTGQADTGQADTGQADTGQADTGQAALGAVSSAMSYNTDLLELVSCTANPDDAMDLGSCNPDFAADALRFNAVSAPGLTSGSLVQAIFRLKDGATLATLPKEAIRLDQVSVFDLAGEELAWRLVEPFVVIDEPAPDPTPIPTPEPEPDPAPEPIPSVPGAPTESIYLPIVLNE